MDKTDTKNTKNTKNIDTNDESVPSEIHTSLDDAKKAEEEARQERMQDQQAEKHAHDEADLLKQLKQDLLKHKK